MKPKRVSMVMGALYEVEFQVGVSIKMARDVLEVNAFLPPIGYDQHFETCNVKRAFAKWHGRDGAFVFHRPITGVSRATIGVEVSP